VSGDAQTTSGLANLEGRRRELQVTKIQLSRLNPFARTDGLALQLRVLINPLRRFLQSKIVGGIFGRESFIELSLMGENRSPYF
jgi:hypothetical protein